MIEFLRKFENRDIKIARVNSILITKSINLQLFIFILYSVGGPLWSKANFSANFSDNLNDLNYPFIEKSVAKAKIRYRPMLKFVKG